MGKGTEKERLKRLIIELERIGGREKVALWRRTAELLALPRRSMVAVNAGKIARVCKNDEVALVPGKLLGDGVIERKITVAAFEWTPAARRNIEQAGGNVMHISELAGRNPKGTGVRLMR